MLHDILLSRRVKRNDGVWFNRELFDSELSGTTGKPKGVVIENRSIVRGYPIKYLDILLPNYQQFIDRKYFNLIEGERQDFSLSFNKKKLKISFRNDIMHLISDDISKVLITLRYDNYFGLLKNHVNTVSKPITNGEFDRKGLVDMEAYKIYEVINQIDNIENLFILKIVSDFMNLKDSLLSFQEVYNFIKQNLIEIDIFLKAIRKF